MTTLDPQAAIDTAFNTSKHILGAGEAGEFYRLGLAGSFTVTQSLTKTQRSELEKYLDILVLYKPGSPNTSDHPVMAAQREIVRQVYEKLFHVNRTTIKTLIVGASFREIKMYDHNNAIEYYFGQKDNKDYDRVVKTALEAIGKELVSKVKSKDNRLMATESAMNPRLKRYHDLMSIYKDYTTLGKRPPKYHCEPIEAEILAFEDSIYEFDPYAILDIFNKTKANMAVGYCLLPLELYFKDMPRNNLYYLVEDGDTTEMRYTGGYSNGYSHKTVAWKMLLQCPVITHSEFDFSLVIEIVSRIGPFAVFTLTRGTKHQKIVRSISIPQRERYLRILDVLKSIDLKTGKRSNRLHRFSVRESEFISIVNFLLSIDIKSMTIETAMTFMRRRGGGASLMSQEVLAPWDLHSIDYYRTALTAYLYATVIRGKAELAVDNLNITGCYDRIMKILYTITYPLTFWMWPIVDLVQWIFSENLTHELVQTCDGEVLQRAWVIPADLVVNGHYTLPYDDEPKLRTNCPVCLELHGRLKSQKIRCNHVEDSYITIKLTQEELTELYTKLIDDDNDPQGLAAIKQEAAKNMPRSGFEKRIKAYYFKGGPGTGKSYIAKLIADSRDLIYAPFTKLKAEYMNVDDGYGNKRDLPFATVHRGFRARGCRRVIIDEFTSLPWEYQQIVLHLSGADEVWFFGDDRQTKTLEPQEGKYIGNYVDLDKLSTHHLMVNFRLKRKLVALLNTMGYEMEAFSEEEGEIRVGTVKELEGKPIYRMAFTHLSCNVNDLDVKSTVRANQGTTHKCDLALFISALDVHTLNSMELTRVAVSRQTGNLILIPDGSEVAKNFIARLNIDSLDTSKLPVYDEPAVKIEDTPDEVEAMINNNSGLITNSGFVVDNTSIKYIRVPEAVGIPNVTMGLPSNSSHCDYKKDIKWAPNIKKGKSPGINLSNPTPASLSLAKILTQNPSGPLRDKLRKTYYTFNNCLEDPIIPSSPPPVYIENVAVNNMVPEVSFEGKDLICGPTKALPSVFVTEDILTYFPAAPESIITSPGLPELVCVEPKPLQTGKNALELLSTLVNPVAQIDEISALNELSSLVVPPGFRNGVVDPDVLMPINQRGHPKQTNNKYHRFCSGPGLHFIPNRPGQVWNALRTRYVGEKKKYEFTTNAKLLARNMATEFVREHMVIKPILDQDAQVILNEFLQSAKAKHYEEQYVGHDNTDARLVRFHLKEIFKPKDLKSIDLNKVGQGISAWSKDAVIKFGVAMRLINKMLKDSFASHVFYDNRETEEKARLIIKNLINSLPKSAKKAVTDHGEFDAAQNEFTQEIEREILRALHISEEFIAEYYSFRNNYVIQAPETRCKADSEKTSGEPGTLPLNTIVAAVMTNYLVRGKGPSILVVKGDDGFKMQVGIDVDNNRYDEVRQFVNMKLKIQLGDQAEFCGNAIVDDVIVPSIIRKTAKLVSKRFRDYNHFTEYQISLRDWVSKVQNDDYFKTCAYNAKLYDIPESEVVACFEAIQSASHVDQTTFRRLFPIRIDKLSISTSNGINLDL